MAALPEDLMEGKGDGRLLDEYPPFFLACGALIAIAGVVLGLFPLSQRLQSVPIYVISLFTGLFAVAWYRWAAGRSVNEGKLVLAAAVYLAVAVLLVFVSGDINSPFIFLTLPPLVLAGITLAAGPTLALALSTAVGLVGGALIQSGVNLQVTEFWWTAIASIAVIGALSGLVGRALRRRYRALEEAKSKADSNSNVDDLTGLYNRRHLNSILPQEVERARRYGRPLTLLMVDSDHLKEMNDSHGHHAGDELLKAMARIISEQIRLVDTAIRFGGDEFIVILPDTDLAAAMIPAERIRAMIGEHPIESRGEQVFTTACVGVASFPESADDSMTLLEHVDQALYASKRNGRNLVTAYSKELSEVGVPAD
ncbi:MAG TPA: GGDEF domain-containing protein [Chloroflexota bacterium]